MDLSQVSDPPVTRLIVDKMPKDTLVHTLRLITDLESGQLAAFAVGIRVGRYEMLAQLVAGRMRMAQNKAQDRRLFPAPLGG